MAAATLSLSSTLQIHRLVFTCPGHKPAITISPRNRTMTFYQPTSFPHGHLHVMCGHKSSHVAHAVRAGEMKGDDGKRARGVVGPTVVLACVLGTMCLTLPMCRPSLANAAPWPFSSWSAQEEKEVTRAKNEVAYVTPDSALEALMDMEKAKTIKLTKKVKIAQDFLETHTAIRAQDKESRIDLVYLQKAARNLASSGKTDAAVEKLKNTYKILKVEERPQEAYNFGLVLVELLIYQGKYDEANKLVEEIEKLLPSSLNADPKLYKAAIHLMLRDVEEQNARQSWNEYINVSSFDPRDEGEQVDGKPVTFQQFNEQIKKLRKN